MILFDTYMAATERLAHNVVPKLIVAVNPPSPRAVLEQST
jgi:hypothetical protein